LLRIREQRVESVVVGVTQVGMLVKTWIVVRVLTLKVHIVYNFLTKSLRYTLTICMSLST